MANIGLDDLLNEKELRYLLGVSSKQGHLSQKDQMTTQFCTVSPGGKGFGEPSLDVTSVEKKAADVWGGQGADQAGQKYKVLADPADKVAHKLDVINGITKEWNFSCQQDDLIQQSLKLTPLDSEDGVIIDIQKEKTSKRGQQAENPDTSTAHENPHSQTKAVDGLAPEKLAIPHSSEREDGKRKPLKRPYHGTDMSSGAQACCNLLIIPKNIEDINSNKGNFGKTSFTFDDQMFSHLLNLKPVAENNVLGSGASGSAKKVVDIGSLKILVQKSVNRIEKNEILVPYQFPNEVNIAKVLGFGKLGSEICIIQEDAGVSLLQLSFTKEWSLLKEPGRIEYILLDIFRAIQILALHGITHSDIKPENICFDQMTLRAKLIDFGSCKTKQDEPNFAGHTPEYLPPHTLAKAMLSKYGAAFGCSMPRLTEKDDVWAAGMVGLFLLIKAHPMIKWVTGNANYKPGDDRAKVIEKICNLCDAPCSSTSTSTTVTQMVKELLASQDYKKDHPNVEELLEKVLVVDEDKRWTAAEAVQFLEKCLDLVPNATKKARMEPEDEESFLDIKKLKQQQEKPVCPGSESLSLNNSNDMNPQVSLAVKQKTFELHQQNITAPQHQSAAPQTAHQTEPAIWDLKPRTQLLKPPLKAQQQVVTPQPQFLQNTRQANTQPLQHLFAQQELPCQSVEPQQSLAQQQISTQMSYPLNQTTGKPSSHNTAVWHQQEQPVLTEWQYQHIVQEKVAPSLESPPQQIPAPHTDTDDLFLDAEELMKRDTQQSVRQFQQGVQEKLTQFPEVAAPQLNMEDLGQCDIDFLDEQFDPQIIEQIKAQLMAMPQRTNEMEIAQSLPQFVVQPQGFDTASQSAPPPPLSVAPPAQQMTALQSGMTSPLIRTQKIPDASKSFEIPLLSKQIPKMAGTQMQFQSKSNQPRSADQQPQLKSSVVNSFQQIKKSAPSGTSSKQPLIKLQNANICQYGGTVYQPGPSQGNWSSSRGQAVKAPDQFQVDGLWGGSLTFEIPKRVVKIYKKKKKNPPPKKQR